MGGGGYPRRVNSPSDLETLRSEYRARVEAVERAMAEELAALSDEAALERTLSLTLFWMRCSPVALGWRRRICAFGRNERAA